MDNLKKKGKEVIENIKEFLQFNTNIIIKVILILAIIILIIFLMTKVKTKDNKLVTEDSNTFYSNLNTMKIKALKYFNEENLPKEINESKTITLKELIENGNIKPIKDENNNICDNTKSYAKITKKESEYQMKVNLSCSDIEDYIIVHLNHYDYCKNTYLCVKKEINKKDTTNNTNKNNDNNNNKTIINLKNNINNTKGNKNNTSRNKKRIKSVVKVTNKGSNYIYQYKKVSTSLTDWSNWSNEIKTDCNTKEVICTNSNCLKEINIITKTVKIGEKQTTNSYYKNNIISDGSRELNTASNSDFVNIDGGIYRVSNARDYSYIYGINDTIKRNIGGWRYDGISIYDNPPADTYNTHYIMVGLNIKDKTRYKYSKYTYTNSLIRVNTYNDEGVNTKRVAVLHFKTINKKTNVVGIEDVYDTTCYMKTRNREIKNTSTSYKWSSYNDKQLLNSGYIYTGKLKKK